MGVRVCLFAVVLVAAACGDSQPRADPVAEASPSAVTATPAASPTPTVSAPAASTPPPTELATCGAKLDDEPAQRLAITADLDGDSSADDVTVELDGGDDLQWSATVTIADREQNELAEFGDLRVVHVGEGQPVAAVNVVDVNDDGLADVVVCLHTIQNRSSQVRALVLTQAPEGWLVALDESTVDGDVRIDAPRVVMTESRRFLADACAETAERVFRFDGETFVTRRQDVTRDYPPQVDCAAASTVDGASPGDAVLDGCGSPMLTLSGSSWTDVDLGVGAGTPLAERVRVRIGPDSAGRITAALESLSDPPKAVPDTLEMGVETDTVPQFAYATTVDLAGDGVEELVICLVDTSASSHFLTFRILQLDEHGWRTVLAESPLVRGELRLFAGRVVMTETTEVDDEHETRTRELRWEGQGFTEAAPPNQPPLAALRLVLTELWANNDEVLIVNAPADENGSILLCGATGACTVELSRDLDGRIVDYAWLLDGVPISSEPSFHYPISAIPAGLREVTLRVTDDDGATSEARATIDRVVPAEGPSPPQDGCSAAGMAAPPPADPSVPAPVAATRDAIIAAALACDFDRLAQLGLADGVFTFTFGAGDDPASFWREQEQFGFQPLRMLLEVLARPFARTQFGDLVQYVWPSAFAFPSWAQVPEPDREALRPLYGDADFAAFADYGNYIGLRVAIKDDGAWRVFVGGD